MDEAGRFSCHSRFIQPDADRKLLIWVQTRPPQTNQKELNLKGQKPRQSCGPPELFHLVCSTRSAIGNRRCQPTNRQKKASQRHKTGRMTAPRWPAGRHTSVMLFVHPEGTFISSFTHFTLFLLSLTSKGNVSVSSPQAFVLMMTEAEMFGLIIVRLITKTQQNDLG